MKIELKDNFITDDTREVIKGCYFLSSKFNAKFEQTAKENGVKVINLDKAKELLGIDSNIKIVGITGTNGKTTTAAAIYSTLLDLRYSVFLCGTRGAFVNEKQVDKKGLTTSSPIRILSYLKTASYEKCDYFIMEVSSHAIAQNRIEGLNFALKIFTNITQDHLDYHKTMAEYLAVKSSFFMDETPKLINKDQLNGLVFNPKNAYTYGIKEIATFKVVAYSIDKGIDATIKTLNQDGELESDMVGEFNLYNLLAAFSAVAILTKKPNLEITKALSNFAGVAGRMELVSDNPRVIVDFAHTPDGVEKVLNALKHDKLIVVFGAGGDRDKTKRPLMAAIAEHFAYKIIVTSDNPRTEDANSIIDDIFKGFKDSSKVLREVDRKKAIKAALNLAQNGEVVVILGKGDEDYQEINGVKHHFSDKEVVREILCK
ncbi:UDP-N-acetylmuramoyl-L-alanyl-D-glutamate--2,6-diaminopimelate ligase [Campylobacter corcagiensis]|uniref:UDP-N-acetylmuramoyl-L-alanyl-D-glutamate--2,6-diaminopimelate ligase n=1 Tax=Campylobacter corcagiensis TaxID=1448857 RepID=A0A7M1LJJ1_9BACT|nr:UDP-N-acetylmuramoyl-L-alanyl-D-glutamate--2,6-diaminopimelate ligase [Campylobacter corcagiensis]QKF65440.1 UDP-N-acetylmuramoylalanyl-D-glutamate 2,6-diaminopimelate ligase [Campylobacter corcagiensis]QOQ87986.1 UDP-N-acetylmuramoyl-L-alanyl-D-glutamate--2,6-diaminopimelate ligase [Campylobacter corcagiensis]